MTVKKQVRKNLKRRHPKLSEDTIQRIAEEAVRIYEERQMEGLSRSVAATD